MTIRLAMLMDDERLQHERRLLSHLTRALIERHVTLIQIVPEVLESPLWEGVDAPPDIDLRLETSFRGSPWLRSLRIRQLVQRIDRDVPDFLLAIGAHTWPMAIGLGAALDRPVGLEVWTRAMTEHLPRGRKASAIAAVTAPTGAITEVVATIVDRGLACHVPWGVPFGPSRSNHDHARTNPTIVITGSCRDVPAYQSLLSGLSRVVRDLPSVQAFLELGGSNEHEIWRIVSRLGLHANVTITPNASGPEQLLTQCDALLVPERFGQMRSIILEAMANGMTVIASEDPVLDMLTDEHTALTLSQPDAAGWAGAIRRVATDGSLADRIGRNAQELVRDRFSITQHAETLCDVVHRARDGEVIQFPTG